MTLVLANTNPIASQASGLLRLVTEQFDDPRLVAGIIDGDEKALESIFRTYGGAVQFVASRVLRDESRAEDVVQDVFVSFWRSPEKFDANRGSLRTYLLTIAHRRAVDVVRSEEARMRREESSDPTETIDIDHEVWVRNQGEIVRDAVAKLGEDERKAISLAYFGGLTYVEVARKLDEPEGTVKSRIRSGMKKLADALSELAP